MTSSKAETRKLRFRPVTPATKADFVRLFEARGGPSYCWCMAWRAVGEEKTDKGKDRKPFMLGRIDRRVPVGLLGYADGEPVAWISLAPRDTYRGLGGPEGKPGESIWSLACMYLRRDLRGEGLGHQLIDAAIAYAKKRKADVLEAYPVDPESPSYRFMGFIPAFEAAGFFKVGEEGTRRSVMRMTFP